MGNEWSGAPGFQLAHTTGLMWVKQLGLDKASAKPQSTPGAKLTSKEEWMLEAPLDGEPKAINGLPT